MKNRLLIYGATGFTGELIAREAAKRWQAEDQRARRTGAAPPARAWHRRPILASRDARKLQELGSDLGLPWAAVALADRAGLDRVLSDVAVVLNAAGPYKNTAEPMVKACLRNGTHYLDISGEFETFRRIDNFHEEATYRNVMIMPGVGFTVVTSDFLIKLLSRYFKQRELVIDQLRVALSSVEFMSRGTIGSMLESTREGVSVRRRGVLSSVAVGQLDRTFTFGTGADARSAVCVGIRLPDLITAPYTSGDGTRPESGAPNIETYGEADTVKRFYYEVASTFALPLQLWPLKNILMRQVSMFPEGPSSNDREDTRQVVVVEAEDRYRSLVVTGQIRTPNSYDFTAWIAVVIAERLLAQVTNDQPVNPGFRTPANVFFDELASALEDNSRVEVADLQEQGLGAHRHARP